MTDKGAWRRLIGGTVALVLIAALGACGGEGGGDAAPAPAPPAITTQPQAQSATVGGSVSFTVTASGSGLSYQWQRGGTAMAGATGATLTLPAVTLTDDGARFRAVVSNAGGSVTSAEAVLTVSGVPTGLGSLGVSGPGVAAGYVFVPTTAVPKAGVPPVIWAALGGLQQLAVTMWSSGGTFTGVSITGPGTVLGLATGVINVNCNVGGIASGCDFAALRITVDEAARTLVFDNSPIPVLGAGTVTVSGTLRW
jgi:hypothetical protein